MEEYNKHPHKIAGVVEKWARETPDKTALIFYDSEKEITYRELYNMTKMFAFKLYNMGFRKGDILVTSLSNSYEHIILGYACAKLGVLWCPLDLRFKPPEIMICISLIRERTLAYCHLGKTNYYNFGMIGSAIQKNNTWLKYVIQFSDAKDKYREGIIRGSDIIKEAEWEYLNALDDPGSLRGFEIECASVTENDPVMLIFTTGTTGFPKPSMLANTGITCQNLCLSTAFDITQDDVMLINLPFAYVGGSTEQLMSIFFRGGTGIVLDVFNARKSLEAIQKYKVTCLGQVPSAYVLEWRLLNYKEYDLSSLKHAIFVGIGTKKEFLEHLSEMAPRIGTGLGLTETSGLCTFSPPDATIDELLESLGHAFPIFPASIREPMKEDGSAGKELLEGEIGEICFKGPQTFKGYFRYESLTLSTISSDNFLYTGDMGFIDKKGLHLVGRKKQLIKSKGIKVFPPEIENYIASMEEVETVAIMGAKHEVFGEGIVAYIKVREGRTLTEKQVIDYCKGIAAYKRPSLIVFLEDLPTNRVAKIDYVALKYRLHEDIEKARASGGWDAN